MNPITVIKVGGASLEDLATGPLVLDAIAALSRVGPVVLVHGGGRAVDRQLARLNMPTQRHNGLRITPADQVEQIVGVLSGTENARIVGDLLARDCRAMGMCLGDGNAVPTRKLTRPEVDLGLVGELDFDVSSNPSNPTSASKPAPRDLLAHSPNVLRLLCEAGFVPVVCSIGIEILPIASMGSSGSRSRTLNINADDAALGVVRSLVNDGCKVAALVLLTDVAGVLDAHKILVPELDRAGIDALVAVNVVSGGMLVKVNAAHETAKALGIPVVIASGVDPVSLSALAQGTPRGTRIVPL